MHIHIQAYTSLKKISDCLIYCILSNGEVIKYHKFIPVVVIELSVRSVNTGPEDRLQIHKVWDSWFQRIFSLSMENLDPWDGPVWTLGA